MREKMRKRVSYVNAISFVRVAGREYEGEQREKDDKFPVLSNEKFSNTFLSDSRHPNSSILRCKPQLRHVGTIYG